MGGNSAVIAGFPRGSSTDRLVFPRREIPILCFKQTTSNIRYLDAVLRTLLSGHSRILDLVERTITTPNKIQRVLLTTHTCFTQSSGCSRIAIIRRGHADRSLRFSQLYQCKQQAYHISATISYCCCSHAMRSIQAIDLWKLSVGSSVRYQTEDPNFERSSGNTDDPSAGSLAQR